MIAVLAALARPLLLVHFMPWFEAPPVAKSYGYHWTMTKTVPPDKIAAKYHPLIGPYDSGDPAVVECQVLLIKLAGFDGVLADWYGTSDLWDYPMIHRNTGQLFAACGKAGLKFGVVYEDQSVKHQIEQRRISPDDGPREVAAALKWIGEHWMRDPSYVKIAGSPALLVFGPQYLPEPQWAAARKGMGTPTTFFTLHLAREGADGTFDWPLPDVGLSQITRFNSQQKAGQVSVTSAYPRFDDYYGTAGVRPSYPVIPDDDGRTYRTTLANGIQHGAAVQVATWNDWGEGTQIEPSVEFGFRDLEETQRQRKKIDPAFSARAEDLRLPIELLRLRRSELGKRHGHELDEISGLIKAGHAIKARARLRKFSAS